MPKSSGGSVSGVSKASKGSGSSKRGGRTRQSDGDDNDHPDLTEWEQRLTEEVDDEFFEDPRKFHTIHRVIDVLGMQMSDDAGTVTTNSTALLSQHLQKNPAYRALNEQRQVVEDAIEHLASIHCTDLNGSVVQVGRVARQFHDAVTQVRTLRKQVKEIQETLGATGGQQQQQSQQQQQQQQVASSAAAASAMSLRELWLKKLEAEAILSLLEKLDQIRAAPKQFDAYLKAHRIGAAVVTVAQALDTMFSSDVAQVQALHKIMEQLMIRKQKAEELVWELLMDVLFLRTANGPAKIVAFGSAAAAQLATHQAAAVDKDGVVAVAGSSVSVKDHDTLVSGKNEDKAVVEHTPQESLEYTISKSGIVNPFLTIKMRFALEYDLQVNNPASSMLLEHQSNADSDRLDDDFYEDDESLALKNSNFIIPQQTMDAEFDLEAEERRSLEERRLQVHSSVIEAEPKPTYTDHVLGLRTLVDCLIRLRRLDDVERILHDVLEKELSTLVQREQARTFLRVEGSSTQQLRNKGGRYTLLQSKAGATTDLRDFRKHLSNILSAFGNVMQRLMHLAQIIRHRIIADKTHTAAYAVPASALTNVILSAKDIMERELKEFLQACLYEPQEKEPEFNINALTNVSGQSRLIAAKTKGAKNGFESGLFSLGIIEKDDKSDGANAAADAWMNTTTSSRSTKIQSLTTPKFVMEVLFAKTTQNGTPQIRHALFFRKGLAKWQRDNDLIRKQLSEISKEDTSVPSYNATNETPSLTFLDTVIQRDLLPILQEEAVNGTVKALERLDAFDPVLDRNVYARADSNEPQDVDMCHACTALYNFTGPLFLALHRLPKGGDMYLPLVAVLEHVILTFISRVKQQVSKICSDKTALQLLMDTAPASGKKDEKPPSFGLVVERRKAFAQLVLAYADGDMLEAFPEEKGELSVVPTLAPSASDTPRNEASKTAAALAGLDELDLVGGVEREEANLSAELQFVKPYLEFAGMEHNNYLVTCPDDKLMKAACLAHSLLKLSSLLDSRLKVRSHFGVSTKTLSNTRALREAIKTIKANGLKMAKFCRTDVLLQAITRLSKVCNSSTIVARDAVRIPSSVNDLGEYMTAASDNLREAAGNAVTAYTFSSLEQYIPLCLIQTVRVLAAGKGIVTKAPLTMNGIEALDRSGSVLYRDLKGATSFDNSFWDIELAAVSFERSASFIAMMELEMAELEAYYQENRNDFSEQDFQLMFSMDGPRRKGDIGKYHMLVKKLDKK